MKYPNEKIRLPPQFETTTLLINGEFWGVADGRNRRIRLCNPDKLLAFHCATEGKR